MSRRTAKMLAAAMAIDLFLALPFGMTSDAFAFGRFGGGGGGGHFGGGHFGGFGGGHFGGFGGRHFGGFGARHFGGFGARHFGGFRGRHFGAAHFAGHHAGIRGAFGHHRFVGQFGHAHALAHAGGLTRNALGHAGLTRNALTHAGLTSTAFAGSTRNAFGNPGGWNAWNHNGWNGGWGWGWGTWAGPVFWPFFYGAALSFALWPDYYYDPFFDYGPDYLFWSLFYPGPYGDAYAYGWNEDPYEIYGYYPGTIYGGGYDGGVTQVRYRHRYRHYHHARRAPEPTQTNETGAACASLAPGISDLPIDKIQSAIQPSSEQTTLLSDLKAASTKANEILRASCPSQVPLTPVGRLEAVGKRLDATIEAMNVLRDPLTKLYDSLGDEQKKRFEDVTFGKRRAQASKPSGNVADLCKQQAQGLTNLPVQSIEQTIKPTGVAKDKFKTLQDASAKAANDVQASCPTSVPDTLADRFDTIVKRLDAMDNAVKTVQPALTDFYSSLDDEQKAQFNVMPPPTNAGAQRG